MNNSTELRCYEELYKQKCKKILEETESYRALEEYDNFKEIIPEETFKIIIKRKNNRRNKRYRTRQKFIEMVALARCFENKTFVFGTIMPNDKELALKEDTYMRRINKWIKRNFIIAIVNKDFGKKTEREHYHFIGFTTKPLEALKNDDGSPKLSKTGIPLYELQNKSYTGGFEPTLQILDLKEYDIKRTINYLLKLNNHSSKIGTNFRIRVIKNPICKFFIKTKIQ